MPDNCYILATRTHWHVDRFITNKPPYTGKWGLVTRPQDLENMVRTLNPRYVFFPHWSEIVPQSVLDMAECVCFHMADVPYGRGGSPLQNLIVRGHDSTVVSALRMVGELDAGPVYAKKPLDLSGTAEQIFERCADVCSELIEFIIATEPTPVEQKGEVVKFKRRVPEQSVIPEYMSTVKDLHDHIRMLDATGYPHAFIDRTGWRLTFTDAQVSNDGEELTAKVRFRRKG